MNGFWCGFGGLSALCGTRAASEANSLTSSVLLLHSKKRCDFRPLKKAESLS